MVRVGEMGPTEPADSFSGVLWERYPGRQSQEEEEVKHLLGNPGEVGNQDA